MQPGEAPRHREWPTSIAVFAALRALGSAGTLWAIAALAIALSATGAQAPVAALAAATRPSAGDLSPRLAELAKPAVRSAPPAKQARALSLAAAGPASLLREGNRVLVEVRFDHGAAASADDLRSAGAKVIDVSPQYQTVTVAAKPAELRALSRTQGAVNASEVLAPITSAAVCPSGPVVSEGDTQLHAQQARSAFEVDGRGIDVGVLSDSFATAPSPATNAAEDAASGNLPGNSCSPTPAAHVFSDYAPGSAEEPQATDEGRAMAQIVHDLAPRASISFATAFTGLTAFAGNIESLAAFGADVIVDDVSYFEEPFFQEGPAGVAVGNVTQNGVSYFSSAGNNNLIDEGRDIASWEAPQFRDAGACPSGVVELSEEYEEAEEELEAEFPEIELPGTGLNASHCLDFDPDAVESDTTFGVSVESGATLVVDLQWAEPWFGVGTDLDAFLLGPGGAVIAESAEDNVFGTERPFEPIAWENTTGEDQEVDLAINRYSGSDPRVKLALLQNGGGVPSTEYPESAEGDVVGPTIFGHNGAEDTMTVGAIRYNASASPEKYSSRGPVTHHFGPVDGTFPAEPLPAPLELSKPDFTATDCGQTSFFVPAGPSTFRFCGTSAAAPHAAAIAALMLDRNPTTSPAQVRAAISSTAAPIGTLGSDAVGSGLVDAMGAVGSIEPLPETTGTVTVFPPDETDAGGEPQPAAPTPRPATFFRHKPRRVARTARRTARAVFGFGSTQAGSTFLCKVDRGRFHKCPARFVRRYRVGRHVMRVRARGTTGAIDATPAVYRFRVKRVARRRIAGHGGVGHRRHTHHHHAS